MKFALNKCFFLQGLKNVLKMKIKGVTKNLISFFKYKVIVLNICLGISLKLLWEMWGQFNVRYFLVPACTCS